MFVVTAGLAAANAVTSWRLWRSPIFEAQQKILQTVLIWLLPGMFVAVAHLMRDPMKERNGRDGSDSTVGRDENICDVDTHQFSHGSDGGGHLP